jgi:hypothetical protein
MMKQTFIFFIIFLVLVTTSCHESPTAKVTANIQDSEKLGKCNLAVTLSVVDIGGKRKVCFEGNVLKLDILNSRNNWVERMDLTIQGRDETVSVRNVENIGNGAVFKGEAEYNHTRTGPIITVEAVPWVDIDGRTVKCETQGITIEDIDECW